MPYMASLACMLTMSHITPQFGGSYDSFSGCGSLGLDALRQLEIKSSGGGSQAVCIDLVKLLST